MDFLRSGLRPSLRKSTVLYHKVTAILILFQLAIAICGKYLLNSEIKFRVSPTLFENKEQWWKGVKVDGNYLYISEEEKDYIEPIEISIEYFNYIENQLLNLNEIYKENG